MPVRYYKAPFQTQQPGGFGDVLQNAANNWARYGKTPDELAELRARTGLYDAQRDYTGAQTTKLGDEHGDHDRTIAGNTAAGVYLGGLAPDAPQGDVSRHLMQIAGQNGLDPTAFNKAMLGFGATHGWNEDQIARGQVADGMGPSAAGTANLPGTKSDILTKEENAAAYQAFGVADRSAGASMYDARLRDATARRDTDVRAEVSRTNNEDTNKAEDARKKMELDEKKREADAAEAGRLTSPVPLNPNQLLASPLYEMLDGEYPEGFKPDPRVEAAMRAEADQGITADPQHPAAVVAHVRQHWLGSNPTQEGGSHFWSGTPRLVPGKDATSHLPPAVADDKGDGTAPTVSPPPGENTAGNPFAANAGQQGAGRLPPGVTPEGAIAQARQAIAAGKDPRAVAARLKQIGIDPAGLN